MTIEEVEQTTDVRWPFEQPATLIIHKPGGLSAGMHTIQFNIIIRKSYWPKTDPDALYSFMPLTGGAYLSEESATKKVTLVQ